VQLHGHYITLFWATETVLLLWLYQRSFIRLLKIASALVTALMLISLFMDWMQVYGPVLYTAQQNGLAVIANKGFITGVVCAAAMAAVYALLRREADTCYLPGITNSTMRYIYLTIPVVLLFCTGGLEINWQFNEKLPGTGIQFIYLQLYVIAFFVLLFSVLQRLKVTVSSTVRLAAPLLIFLLYLANVENIYTTEKAMLATGNNKIHFIAEWISIVLLLVLVYRVINYVRNSRALFAATPGAPGVLAWVITVALIIIFSVEIRHLFVWLYYSGTGAVAYAENLYSKAGLSIVWGLLSFIIIWLGLSKKYKPLRVIALVLFGITLVKLFAYDIQNIPPAGKITAFILLGVVLLVVSFMYQRLKKLIFDDAHNTK
jgi:hypothetical protein